MIILIKFTKFYGTLKTDMIIIRNGKRFKEPGKFRWIRLTPRADLG
jgi:hypothetical protein